MMKSIKRAILEEFVNLSPRLLLADALVIFLPRLCFLPAAHGDLSPGRRPI